jgi:hypothetical protein
MSWWRRWRSAPDAVEPPDAWQPPLGVGYWRTRYAECCDTLLAYDRLLATLPAGELHRRLTELRPALQPVLDRARQLAELGALLEPAGPIRDPRIPAMLAEDKVADLRGMLGTPGTDPLMRELVATRRRLQAVVDDAARLAVEAYENPAATDVVGWLDALAEGVEAAGRAGWTAAGYD